MNIIKKLFKRKKKSNAKVQEDNNLEKFITYFESCDGNQINNLKKFQNILKNQPSTKSEIIHEFIESGIEYSKDKKYEKIVNEYGEALMEATELNRRKVEEYSKNINRDSINELADKKAIFYHLQNKFDIRLLPYDKNTIKEAIESLIQDETDVKKIEQLKVGLSYLDDFIDFSQFGP
ncbi:MAG: hypothetical protein H8E80_09675 [Desulfobacteraceae bacterium]|uniref:Uncharacterized protein n=1 Tax=Candidatus Desulfaltia bathyphila TaxID=2841697 RepID=A0A8J6N9Q2_9BACT|nr:hypothetical protein [Candidatus Desulfaltia bathyphila]